MRHFRQPAFVCLAAFLVAGTCPLPTGALDFGPKTGAVLYGFQTRSAGGAGKTRWELSGGRAVLREAWYELEDFRLTLHLEDGSTAVLTSPRCRYDEAGGTASSPAPIQVVGDQLTLRGVGYDMLLDKKKLRIRSKVRMTIRRAIVPREILPGRTRKPAVSSPAAGPEAHPENAKPEDEGEK
jgi:hypothetical protein